MKFLYTIILIALLSNQAFAQFSIRNNHYVFVSDEVVFIEDDLNLNEATSTFYLRNEGQLIQGTGTEIGLLKNSGIGELSVYQNGNVDAYEYNYWCSPIGAKTNTTANNPFGISLLNDVISLTTAIPATYSHAVNYNGTSSPLNIEPFWIWKFIASDAYADWIHVEANTTINAGEGFTMKGTAGSGSNQNYDFRGKPNTGTIGVNVLDNNLSLVGNPYPSAMDALAYIHDAENATVITGTLYYWEQDSTVDSHLLRDYDGGYASYTINATGTIETYTPATFSTYNGDGTINGAGSGNPSGKTPRRYIPIGQGFMVEGTTSVGSPQVKAKNSHRVFEKENSINSEFFRNSNTPSTQEAFSKIPEDYQRFRLNISFDDAYTRQLVETLHPTATVGFDYGLESKVNESITSASDAYFSGISCNYIAEALPFDIKLKIPLTIQVETDMNVKITSTDIQHFEENQPIYIHDIEKDTYTNLRTDYFQVSLKEGHYDNRFEVTFKDDTILSINESIATTELKIYQNNDVAFLKILRNNTKINHINLFDITGKQVLNERITSIEPSYEYTTKSMSNGVYIVKIHLENNETYSKKIIIKN